MKQLIFLIWTIICGQSLALAHQSSITYVANEAVLITNGDKKVLFDPFFHQAFGTYQLVPAETKQAIFSAAPPFDKLTAIVISHAHGDHFAADEVLKYMLKHPTTQLIAPEQAVTELMALTGAKPILTQVTSVKLAFNQAPKTFEVAGLMIDAVRIPHAGWPSRAEVENLVFRVTLNNQGTSTTVMHMGDADPDDDHFLPYKDHWQKRVSDAALPPYWFYFSAEGRDILTNILNVKNSIGIHVPIKIPDRLKSSGQDYFSKPGELRKLDESHEH
ncbi:MBL fold metallo-hydrolase [Paraglaciecola sp. MB-3u-78]|uniref:MBL fold metallo-hydrolase n=1 Tax=Paraglaciecola sp. MB-3u-78 TaxID=2058332 RepID=UPI000C333734|nr:MBL fold metallo-hydrolase [Paraglaciecola sp. MB-3u-78]PKG98495.1 MBL fold metallo-hydrolase [Paraglaciecola sp. MB-3u-78]